MKMKKRIIPIALSSLIVLGSMSTYGATTLNDIENSWAKSYINRLVEKKIINGYPDSTFRPNNNITREEVSKVLSSYMGEKEVENDKLSDIENRWSTKFIKHLVSEGIITGYPDGSFKPSNNVTRAEFATMTYKYLKGEEKLKEGALNSFKDIEDSWAKEYIQAVSGSGYINGYPDGTFRPNNFITRAEVSTMIALIDGAERVEQEKPKDKEDNKGKDKEENKNNETEETKFVTDVKFIDDTGRSKLRESKNNANLPESFKAPETITVKWRNTPEDKGHDIFNVRSKFDETTTKVRWECVSHPEINNTRATRNGYVSEFSVYEPDLSVLPCMTSPEYWLIESTQKHFEPKIGDILTYKLTYTKDGLERVYFVDIPFHLSAE